MNDLSLSPRTHAVASPLVATGALDLSRRTLPGFPFDHADPDHV